MSGKRYHSLFRRFNLITIGTVYLVILAGGVVRCTGSGMGCPDWPRCFGTWVPPTDVSQLPADYKQKYKVQGHEAEFNVAKTWTEYGNRLVGALTGIFIFCMFVYSIPFYKEDKQVFYFSLLGLLLVGFQGWLGAKVVASYLSPVMITLHMALAMLLIGVLWYVYFRASKAVWLSGSLFNRLRAYKLWLWLLAVATFIQIIIGTQVREEIDMIADAMNHAGRGKWIDLLKENFMAHRILSYFIAALTVYLLIKARMDWELGKGAKKVIYAIGFFITLEMIIGYVLVLLQLPAFAQPLHLLNGSIILGLELLLLMVMLNIQYTPLSSSHVK
ncbi:MAG: heme synthase [Chitinophagaceae bacterium]|nr:heme synthase [Chitinophagaceae bacterium]